MNVQISIFICILNYLDFPRKERKSHFFFAKNTQTVVEFQNPRLEELKRGLQALEQRHFLKFRRH